MSSGYKMYKLQVGYGENRKTIWLMFFQDTPNPGLYHISDFIKEAELNPVRKMYGFKGVGRKAQTLGKCEGKTLQPGAHDYTNSFQEVRMHQPSYFFKNCPRPDIITLGIRDKVGFRPDSTCN